MKIITSRKAMKSYTQMKIKNALMIGPMNQFPRRLDKAVDQIYKKMVHREAFLLCGIAIGFFVARFLF